MVPNQDGIPGLFSFWVCIKLASPASTLTSMVTVSMYSSFLLKGSHKQINMHILSHSCHCILMVIIFGIYSDQIQVYNAL